jgi:long-chain acyl-CoA synthetase
MHVVFEMDHARLDLVSLLDASVGRHPEEPLFGVRHEEGWRWITYAQFARDVDAFRASLARLGVGAGDRVAIIADNSPAWAVAAYASFGLGATFVPMYEAQLPSDWRHILEDSGARICLVADEAMAARVSGLGVATVRRIVPIHAREDEPLGYPRLLREGAEAPLAAVVPSPSSIAEIVYTSGTTGVPKGVLLTHANVVSNVDSALAVVPLDHTARTLSFLPWAHVMGGDELHAMMRLGASMALCGDVDKLAERLLEVRPTLLFAVPRVWNTLYQAVHARIRASSRPLRTLFEAGRRASAKVRRHESLSAAERVELAVARKLVFSKVAARFGGRLHYAVSGAAALAPEVAELIDDLGIVVLEAYGMTETSCVVTINPPRDRRIGSVGKAVPGVRIVIDETAPGGRHDGTGEIIVYGHGVMAGYHGMPEETARTLTPDGGVRTGDLGRLDEDGYLYVTGRIKELYKLENGKYVAPAPLEEKLTLSPQIAQAFVFGSDAPHNVALIVPDEEGLRAWATRARIPTSSWDELLALPAVRDFYAAEIDARSTGLREYQRIRAFALLPEKFSTDNGLLTPTLKTKRRKVAERYGALLRALYEPRRERSLGGAAHPGRP